jgi:hypothetical protein
MINFYTLEVRKKADKPCYIVTINHFVTSGVYFFNTLNEANVFVREQQRSLEVFGGLRYNMNSDYNKDFDYVIQRVIHDNNFYIGENGKTYYKETENTNT